MGQWVVMANLISEVLRQGIYTRVIGKRIQFHQEIESTMDEARRLAIDGAEEGTIVVAETQYNSRGRLGRTWRSQPGNIYLSLVLYPGVDLLPAMGIISSLATTRSIERSTGLNTEVKWPNDILVNGRKVAGVLVECSLENSRVVNAVVGVGINIAFDKSTVPELADTATSLNSELGIEVNRAMILRNFLHDFDNLYQSAMTGIVPLEEWKLKMQTLGQVVTVYSNDSCYTGVAEDIDDYGSLILRFPDGETGVFSSGDVSLDGTRV